MAEAEGWVSSLLTGQGCKRAHGALEILLKCTSTALSLGWGQGTYFTTQLLAAAAGSKGGG